MNKIYGHRDFVTRDGRVLSLCGRKRAALEELIRFRNAGNGLRKSALPGDPARTMNDLARKGVMIAKFDDWRLDPQSGTGRARVVSYFLFEDWRGLKQSPHEMHAARLQPQFGPRLAHGITPNDLFGPFRSNGLAAQGVLERVQLLNPILGSDAARHFYQAREAEVAHKMLESSLAKSSGSEAYKPSGYLLSFGARRVA